MYPQTGVYSDYVVSATKEHGEPSHELMTAKDVLDYTQAKNIQAHHSLVEITADDSIVHAFQLLVDKKILSLPIYDVGKHRYIGFIDLADIIQKILSVLSKEDIDKGWDQIKGKLEAIKCKEVGNITANNPYKPIEETAPLRATIKLLLSNEVRRVPLVDGSGALVTVVTQSSIVSFLNQHIKKFAWTKKTVKDYQLGYRQDVVTVSSTMGVTQAFALMQSKNISGVPVLDPATDALIGVLKNTDLKVIGLGDDLLKSMSLSVERFVKLAQEKYPTTYQPTVAPDASIKKVIRTLVENKQHHVFVSEEGKIIGVISLRDVLQLVASQ